MSNLDDRLQRAASAVRARTNDLPIPDSIPRTEVGDDERGSRASRVVVALASVAVVAMLVSAGIGLARRSPHHHGPALTIETLTASIEQQSVRITVTQSFGGESGPQAGTFVTTGVIDFRTQNGRFQSFSQVGSNTRQAAGTELLVAGHQYRSIDASDYTVPERVLRTKKWIEVDAPSTSQASGLNPFDPFAILKQLHVSLTDLGRTTLHGHSVEHYRGTKREPTTAPDAPSQSDAVVVDLFVDGHGHAVQARLAPTGAGSSEAVGATIDFADYGTRVEVTAPPANLVVHASALPSDSTPTPTAGRQGALVLRQDIDTSAAECKQPGTLAHTETLAEHGTPMCTELGATIVTGDDVTAAVARPVPGSFGGWCVAPTLTADALKHLHRYITASGDPADLFLISRGKFLGAIQLGGHIANGDCWIMTDRMTQTVARALVAQLPAR